jgi:hypothetical protein
VLVTEASHLMTRDKVESYSGTQDHDQDYGAKQEGDKSGSPIGSLLRGLRDAKGIDEGVRDKEERFHSVPGGLFRLDAGSMIGWDDGTSFPMYRFPASNSMHGPSIY